MPVIRITYYEKGRLPLIAEPLRRAHAAAREAFPDAAIFLRSGWLRGSHLDLCVLPKSGETLDCTPFVEDIRSWVELHPSRAVIDPDEYLAMSKKLGALEGIEGPFTPLRADNTVVVDDYIPPRLVDGHESIQSAYIEFFDRATPLLFDIADLKRSAPSDASMLLVAMLARVADQLQPEGISRGYLSLKAHADMFFANFDAFGKARTEFERLEAGFADQIDAAVDERDGLGISERAREGARSILERWNGVLEAVRDSVTAVARQDSSWFAYNPSMFPKEHQTDARHAQAFAGAGLSHRTIQRGSTLDAILEAPGGDLSFFSSEAFQVFRIIVNMFYSLLPTLSISPVERFGLCYLVASSCERRKQAR